MKAAIANLRGRYITGSRTQRWPFVFCFMSSAALPGDKMQVFAFDDDYSFGVLQALPQVLWYQAKAARLKNEQDYNYSAESVFDTFPWPQFEAGSSRRESAQTSAAAQVAARSPEDRSGFMPAATITKINTVAAAARELRRVRAEALPKLKGGLRALYRTLELPGANPLKDAHAALDAAVLAAYGFSAKKDLLAQLLELNLSVAQRLEKAEPVTPPGIPANFPKPETLISEDCIRPPALK
jgi:hypothetical protein